ncbi:MmgE/PrpD family protein [Oleispirillum naphthae]|uniref:MmgE/PrpD family protein n=1 Tax=Oleispirillum naphthae TaxID=2838853 RepID=UPI0030825433
MTVVEKKETSGAARLAGQPTRALAEFVVGVKRNGVPDGVRAVLADAVLDAIGCGFFGLTTKPCRIAHDFALDQGGPAEASVWCSGGAGKVSLLNTVLANGTAIHGFDFDDHSRAKIHPGAAVLPTALALAERENIDGETFLAAVAAGYEVMNRISLGANPNASRTKGWHLTGTTGTFGAAAAASVILGLDAEATAGAFGLAGTQSSGLWAFTADGAMTKRIHPGFAGRNGLTSALLVQRGFFGGSHILEAEDGSFLRATSDDPRPEEVVRGLGIEWRAEAVCFKPYPCCGSNHASIGASLDLMAENGFAADDVDKVVIGVSRVVLLQTGYPYEKSTVLNAQMNIRYNVAVALLDRGALIEQFTAERMEDPRLEALIKRIDVVVDPEMDAIYPGRYGGIVTIHLKNGKTVTKRVDFSKGMPENRMSPEEMSAKFVSLVASTTDKETAESLLVDLKGIFEMPNVGKIAARLGAPSLRNSG